MINKIYLEYLLLKGDQQSVQQVLSIIQPRLQLFAYSMLKDKSAAQDAVQESMLAIIAGLRKLKNPKAFHSWIYQLTRNKCIDLIRKNRKYKNDIDVDLLDQSLITVDNSDNDDRNMDMINMIRKLPDSQQSVIHLFYYSGFTIIEIAEILHKPAGTIKSLLFDARANLKHYFGE
ncbi:MAG TPA: RNA polymerase sigma factor [Oceanospirillales bacterium]|nr:RNA polymerase sigma factor [Oceanospirillales bacterium]